MPTRYTTARRGAAAVEPAGGRGRRRDRGRAGDRDRARREPTPPSAGSADAPTPRRSRPGRRAADAEGAVAASRRDVDEVDREAAFAAIQAAAEARRDAPSRAGAEAAASTLSRHRRRRRGRREADPRFAALGLTPDFDAAEAEAAAAADAIARRRDPEIGDDALAARLAGLVPDERRAGAPATRPTRVIVTGLVSVASIASFKRHLGRVAGVQSVGVSSGPDGEFVFAVGHATE